MSIEKLGLETFKTDNKIYNQMSDKKNTIEKLK